MDCFSAIVISSLSVGQARVQRLKKQRLCMAKVHIEFMTQNSNLFKGMQATKLNGS
jgi:hypothetical protein